MGNFKEMETQYKTLRSRLEAEEEKMRDLKKDYALFTSGKNKTVACPEHGACNPLQHNRKLKENIGAYLANLSKICSKPTCKIKEFDYETEAQKEAFKLHGTEECGLPPLPAGWSQVFPKKKFCITEGGVIILSVLGPTVPKPLQPGWTELPR